MENDLFLLFIRKASPSLAEYYLENCDAEVSSIFLDLCPISVKEELISKLFNNEEILNNLNEQEKVHFRWFINSIRGNSKDFDENLKKTFIFYILHEINPQYYELTYDSYKSNGNFTIKWNKILSVFNFLTFLHENSSLLHSVQPFISNLVNSISFDRLFSYYSISALDFYSNPPLEQLAKSKYIVKSIKECFECPSNYIHPNVAKIFQIRFTNAFCFPESFPEVDEGITASLIHSTVLKGVSFIDVMSSAAERVLFEESDFKKIISAFENDSCESLAWICCSFIKKTVCRPRCIERLYLELKKKEYSGIAFETIERLYSDVKMIIFASERLKKKITSADLLKYSIPRLLEMYTFTKDFKELMENKFFIISDDFRDKDLDFVRCFTAISTLIQAMENPLNNQTAYFILINKIIEQLHYIKDKEILHNLIIDIFSTLFIKRNNDFICPLALATLVVDCLASFEDIKEINEMKNALHFAAMKKESKISKALLGRKNLFFQELGSSLQGSAKIIGDCDPYLSKMYRISTSVMKTFDESYEIEDEEIKKEVLIESALSTPFSSKKMDLLHSVCTNDLVNEISKKRSSKSMIIFDKLKEQLPLVIDFDEGQEIDFSSLPPNVSSFMELITILRQCNHIDEPIKDLFVELSSKENILEIAALLKNYGFDIFGFWIEHVDLLSVDENIIKIFIKDYPCECLSLILEGKTKIPEDFEISSFGGIIENYINKSKPKSEENYKELIKEGKLEDALSVVNKLEGNELKEGLFFVLRHFLQSFNFNVSLLDDILYRIDINELQDFCLSEYHSFRIRNIANLIDFITLPPKALLYISSFIFSVSSPYENPKIEEYMQNTSFRMCLCVVYNKIPFNKLLAMFDENDVNENIEFICKNIIVTPNDLKLLLAKFPSVISSSFTILKTDPTFYNVFKQNFPEKYKAIFSSLICVPDIIIKNKGFDFTEESVKASIKTLLLEYHGVEMMKPLLNRYRSLCGMFSELKGILDDTVKVIINREIGSIKVLCEYQENQARNLLNILLMFRLEEEEMEKLETVKDILSIGLFQRYSASYSFEGYPNECFTKRISELLFRYDFNHDAIQTCEVFNSSFKEIANQRINICFSLGILDHARFWAPYADIDPKTLTCLVNGKTPTDEIVATILKQKEGNIGNIGFNYVKSVKKLCLERPKPSESRVKLLQNIVSFFVHPQNKVINFLCVNKFYDTALNLLYTMHQTEGFLPCFIHDFVFPIISYCDMNDLIDCLHSFDSGTTIILPLLIGLSDFFKEKKMSQSLFNFYVKINWIEDAALTAIDIFNTTNNFSKKLMMIYCAGDLMNQSNNIRECILNCTPGIFPFRPSSLNEKQINHLHECVKMHKKLFEYSKNAKSEDYTKAVSVVINNDNAKSIALQLALVCNFSLLNEVSSMFGIKPISIMIEVANIIAPKSFDEIKKYLGTSKKQTKDFIPFVFHPFIDALTKTSKNWCLIPALIGMFIDDLDIQCSYFLEYNFLCEAVDIVSRRKKLSKWIPLIAIKASELGNVSIVNYLEEKHI